MQRLSVGFRFTGRGALLGPVLCVNLLAQPTRIQDTHPVATPVESAPAATLDDRSQQLQQLESAAKPAPQLPSDAYRIGAGDLLEINVLEAPELNRQLRVSAGGEISVPPVGTVKSAGLSPQQLEVVLQELFRRSVLNDPHVTVFVREMQSHPVSVTGAVKKPGVFQISGPKGLLEMLSMAEGLADDAGTTVTVIRGANFQGSNELSTEKTGTAPAAKTVSSPNPPTVEVDIKDLLNSRDPRSNVLVQPGDAVTVSRAGIVYVLGAVKKPGGFLLRNNESISVLQALALAEGLGPAPAKGQTRIVRTDESSGQHTEIPLDLGKLMQGKTPDPVLRSKDVVFVPTSGSKSAFRGVGMILTSVPGALVYRTW